MSSLSLSQFVVQPSWDLRSEYYNLAERHPFGIEIVTLALPPALNDSSVYHDQLRTYRGDLSGFSGFRSIHGPFIDITPHSADASIADASRSRVQRCLEAAQELSCKVAVFHTGINPLIRAPRYRTSVVDSQAAFWKSMLDSFPSVTIALENMWEPEPTILRSIAERASLDRLGICFDCGHANVFSGVAPTIGWPSCPTTSGTCIGTTMLETWTANCPSEMARYNGTDWSRLQTASTGLQQSQLRWEEYLRSSRASYS